MQAFVEGEFLQIEMKNAEEDIYFAGEAMIESIELEASFDDVATYNIAFVGKGPLTVSKGE